MSDIKQAVIFAGGLGTRLAPFTDTAPKPMYPIAGVPYIEHLLLQIRDFGIRDVILLLGYLPEVIRDYVGDGSQYGMQVRYCVTPVEYDTSKRLLEASEMLSDVFLMMYCDNYCPIDFWALTEAYERNNALIQITAYANTDGYTKNNLRIGEDGRVLLYDKKRKSDGLAGVDIGYAVFNKEILKLAGDGNDNFEAVVYPQVVEMGRMYATVTQHRYYSIGSFERINLTEEFFKDKKVVFLDRDGTLNERPPRACYVETPEQFVWLEGAREAVRALNDAGYITILVSNQPGIARGNLDEEMLGRIHDKMQSELNEIGAHIDHIYFCPHNWDEGCDCRKPKPGMLFQAARDLCINLRHSILIGDDERDIEAGEAAGCRCIMVNSDYTLSRAVQDILNT